MQLDEMDIINFAHLKVRYLLWLRSLLLPSKRVGFLWLVSSPILLQHPSKTYQLHSMDTMYAPSWVFRIPDMS